MKILITGAGGMLGTDLVDRLHAKHELIGVGRRPAPQLEIPFHVANLASKGVAADLIDREQPEIILHSAAMTDVDRCETHRREALLSNFEITRNITDAANRRGSFVIFFSTDFVFDGTKTSPYVEEDSPHPINCYGESKLLAEKYLLFKARRFLIIRSSWTFGKHRNNFPKKVLSRADTGKPFRVVADQVGNPTYTGDLADGVRKIVDLFSKETPGLEKQIYHLTNEGIVSRYELARFILKKRNYPLNLVSPMSSEEIQTGARRPKNSSLSTEKIKSGLGVRLRSWQEALDAYLEEDSTLPKCNLSVGGSTQ